MRARSATRGAAALGGPGTCAAWAPAGVGTDDTGLTPWQSDRKGVLKDVRSAFKAPKKERQITEVWSYFRSRPKKKRDGCRLGRPAVEAEQGQRLRKGRRPFFQNGYLSFRSRKPSAQPTAEPNQAPLR